MDEVSSSFGMVFVLDSLHENYIKGFFYPFVKIYCDLKAQDKIVKAT